MTKRTVEDLHSKDYGHRKFAKVVDILIDKGYKVTNIKEYYEKFKFDINNVTYEYSKDWKVSAEKFVRYLEDYLL